MGFGISQTQGISKSSLKVSVCIDLTHDLKIKGQGGFLEEEKIRRQAVEYSLVRCKASNIVQQTVGS